MNIKLRLSNKSENESGTVSLVFLPVLSEGDVNIYAISGTINIAIPKSNDIFSVGKEYDYTLTEIFDVV